MFVLLDSNVWISQRGLTSVQADAGREFIISNGATLAIPEVVQLEVEKKLCAELLRHRSRIGDSLRYVTALYGDLDEMSLPTADEIDSRVRNLMVDTGLQIRNIPLTIDAAKSSLNKIVNKQQPSERSEQFVDGVIWAHCLELLEESDVCLVSEDKAFYRDYDYNLGLAPNLIEEATSRSNELRLVRSLEGLTQDAPQGVHRIWPLEK